MRTVLVETTYTNVNEIALIVSTVTVQNMLSID